MRGRTLLGLMMFAVRCSRRVASSMSNTSKDALARRALPPGPALIGKGQWQRRPALSLAAPSGRGGGMVGSEPDQGEKQMSKERMGAGCRQLSPQDVYA